MCLNALPMHMAKLSHIIAFLLHEEITPSDFILSLLGSSLDTHQPAKDSLLEDVVCIFDTFSIVPAVVTAVRSWKASKSIYMQQAQHHFSSASERYLLLFVQYTG
jgi:hypothetical protein